MDKRNLFLSSSEESEQEVKIEVKEVKREPKLQLYQENLDKYVSHLKAFIDKANEVEGCRFGDGIWHVSHPLIEITQINYETNVGIFDLITIDSSEKKEDLSILVYKKLLVIWTFLDNEIEKVQQTLRMELYDSLVMYGEQTKTEEEAVEIMIARALTVFKRVYDLVRKLMSYIEHLVLQLHCIINRKNPNFKQLFRALDFTSALDLLANALRAVYIIDSIVQNNPYLRDHLDLYKKMLLLVKNQPHKFDISPPLLRKLEKTINKLQNTVLSTKCMETITQIIFDEDFQKSNNPLGRICKNKDLKEYFEGYFAKKIEWINEMTNSQYEQHEQKDYLSLLCLYSLSRKLFPEEENKDAWRELWSLQKKMPVLQAHSFVCVYPYVFLSKVCPLSKRPKTDPKDEFAFIAQHIAELEVNASATIINCYTRFCVWLSRMESGAIENNFVKEKGLRDKFSNRIYMLCEGQNIILKLKQVIYRSFILHVNQEQKISKALLVKLTLGIQVLKATAYLLRKKAAAFDTAILTKYVGRDMLELIKPCRDKLQADQGRKSKENIHKVTIFNFLLKMIDSPINELKLTFIRHSLGFLSDWLLNDNQIKSLRIMLRTMELVAFSRVLVQQVQNCSFLFYCRQVLPEMFVCKSQEPKAAKRLQFLFEGLQDAAELTRKCVHLHKKECLFEEFKSQLLGALDKNYVMVLRKRVEQFLRVTISAMRVQKLQGVKPWGGELWDLTQMVQMERVRLFDSIVDMRSELAHAFNDSFYNLNVLNVHDMEGYECMRILAHHLFDLPLHDVFLPSHTLEQSKFDVLAVVRNIPQFVASFKYNLLSQRFLQITTDAKIVRCIGIKQLADAVSTHGLGILATTVNAFYKFLIPNIKAFSQFLFDDQIQNPLSKQRRWLKEFAENADYPGFYPYERVQRLYKQIKAIGKFEGDTTYLDKFRLIVTNVGNSLGFIRLLRSASLNTQTHTLEHLPPKAQGSFQQNSNGTWLGASTQTACSELDALLKDFDDKFSEKTDYLNVILKAFARLTSKDNKHLKQFYLLVPALSLNYVEHVTRAKEQLQKRSTHNAFLYDDGFLMGLAYFLTLLGQHDHYRTLHWSRSLTQYFQQAKVQSKDSNMPDASLHSAKYLEELNTKKMLLHRKIQIMEEEFLFFNYNIVSANVLFKNTFQLNTKSVSPPTQ